MTDNPSSLSVDLTWDAPAGCPTSPQVESEIATLVAGATGRPTHVKALVRETPEHEWSLRLVVEVDGQSSTREFRADSCSELGHAAAVVIAIAVAPHASLLTPSLPASATATVSAEPPRYESPTPSAIQPTFVVVRPPPPPLRPKGRFAVAAEGAASGGAFADPAFGFGAGASWQPGRYRLELQGHWFPPAKVDRTALGIGGEFDLLLGGVRGCWEVLPGRIALSACGGTEVGRVRATGQGPAVQEKLRATAPWVAAKAGWLAIWTVGSVGLRAEVDLIVPLVRNRFVVEGIDSVARPAPVTARALLGAEVLVP